MGFSLGPAKCQACLASVPGQVLRTPPCPVLRTPPCGRSPRERTDLRLAGCLPACLPREQALSRSGRTQPPPGPTPAPPGSNTSRPDLRPHGCRLTSTAAAQAFNIYPRKGLLAPGSDADVIILDPGVEHTLSMRTHHSAMDTNIYEGRKVRGSVVTTVSRGRLVWHDGRLDVAPHSGRLIPLPTHSPWLFDGLEKQPLVTGWAGPPGVHTPVDRSGGKGAAVAKGGAAGHADEL